MTNEEKAALYEEIGKMGNPVKLNQAFGTFPAQQMGSMPAFERQEREQAREALRQMVEAIGNGGDAYIVRPDDYRLIAIRCALRVLGESLDGDAK